MKEGPRILVVEDDPSIYRLISFKLELEGYLVDISTDGQDALNKVFGADYDALILDLMLPSIDGMTILKSIREKKKDLPVIILSAKSQERDVMKGFAAGADDYLVKPFRPLELIIRLKKILKGK